MTHKITVILAVMLASGSVAVAGGKKHYRPIDNGYHNGQYVTEEGRQRLRIRQACKGYVAVVDQEIKLAKTVQAKEDIYDVCMQQGTSWDHPLYHKVLERVLQRHSNTELKKPKLYQTIDGKQELPSRARYGRQDALATIFVKENSLSSSSASSDSDNIDSRSSSSHSTSSSDFDLCEDSLSE